MDRKKILFNYVFYLTILSVSTCAKELVCDSASSYQQHM